MAKTITLNEADSKANKNLEGRTKWFFVNKKLKNLIMEKGTLKRFAHKIDCNYRYLIKLLDGKVSLSDKKMTSIYSGCYALGIYDGGLKTFREEFMGQRKIVVKRSEKMIKPLESRLEALQEDCREKDGEIEDLKIENAKLKKEMKAIKNKLHCRTEQLELLREGNFFSKLAALIKDHFFRR